MHIPQLEHNDGSSKIRSTQIVCKEKKVLKKGFMQWQLIRPTQKT